MSLLQVGVDVRQS